MLHAYVEPIQVLMQRHCFRRHIGTLDMHKLLLRLRQAGDAKPLIVSDRVDELPPVMDANTFDLLDVSINSGMDIKFHQ